jgi:hypothetical protein
MSNFIIIAADMHKIAEFSIDVKYRLPGNVVEYLPVEFEIFQDRNYFKAIPLPCLETRTLTNLRNEYTFQIKNGKTYNCKNGTGEIIDDIITKMAQMNVVEIPQ